MAVQAGEAFIPVRADMSDFGKQVEQGTTKAQGKIKGFAKSAGGLLVGAFAVNQVKNYFGTAISGAREAIAIDKQTQAVIKSTGSAAGVTAEHVDELASRLQKTQTINDEVTQSGANLLLTFTNIRNEMGEGNDVFDKTVELANDMSVAMGQDMKSSSVMLGKALNDPIKGLSALGRVGVQFTKDQKEQIKTMSESGDTLGAQKIILAELDRQFGGSAAAQADAGKKMTLAWDDFTETVGRALIPVVNGLLAALVPITAWAAENPKILMVVAGVVGGALVVAFLAWAASAIAAAAATVAAMAPVLAIAAAVAALTAGVIWAYQNVDIFRGAVDTVARFLTGTVWPAIQAGASLFTNVLVPAIAGVIRWVGDLVRTVASVASTMWDPIARTFRGVVNAIIDAWNALDFSIDIRVPGWVPGVGGKGFQVDDVFPDVPRLHTGGVFQAPPGQREGLAMLLDGERVLSRGESRAGGGKPVELHFHQSGHDPGGVLNALAWAVS